MQDIFSFVNQSNVGDLLLKIIMCGLPDYKAGRPLSPFWQTDPYHACNYHFQFFASLLIP